MATTNWEAVNNALLNVVLSDGGLAIDSSAENIKTAATLTYTINGVFTTKTAASIDLSTMTCGGEVIADGETAYLVCLVDADGSFDVVLVESGESYSVPAGYACFGKVKVVNASGSDFTVGTTELSASGITDTYYDLCRYNG